MSTLSLCMIVRDEEANLERCLASVAGTVDEMVVVDTGSRDRTREIARSFGAKVIEWAWRDDFAAARNVSLDHATGEWILFLDADEELYREDREALRQLTASVADEGYFLQEVNFAGDRPGFDQVTNATLRLFRNRSEYRFQGAIHEQIMPSIVERKGRLGYSKVRVRHYGYLNKAITSQDKIERNLRIALAEVERHPDSAFALFNLGMEYLRLREHEKALEANRRAFLHLPDLTVQYSSRLLRNIVVSLIALKRYEEALRVLDDGTAAYPDFTDLFYQRGLVYLEQKDFVRAVEAFRVCLDKGEAHTRYISDLGVGTYRSHFGLGYASEMMGDYRSAIEAYQESLKECPVLPGPAHRLATLLLRVASPDVVFSHLVRLIDEKDPGSLEAVAIAFKEAKHYTHALATVELALPLSADKRLRLLKGELLLYLGQYPEAAGLLAEDEGSAPARANVFAGLAFLMAGEGARAKPFLVAEAPNPAEQGWLTVLRRFAGLLQGELNGADRNPQRETDEPLVAEAVWGLLAFLLQRGEFDKFERALGVLDLLEASAHQRRVGLGKLYYSAGFEESAVEEFSQVPVQELDAEASEIVGLILERRGMHAEALEFFRVALDRDPENPKRYLTVWTKARECGEAALAEAVANEGLRRFPGYAIVQTLAEREA